MPETGSGNGSNEELARSSGPPASPEGGPPASPEASASYDPALPQVAWTDTSVQAPPTAPILREMGLGDILDASIKLYRKKWKLFIALVAMVQVPFIFIQSFLTFVPFDFDQMLDPEALESQQPPSIFPMGDMSAGALAASVGFFFLYALVLVPFLTAALARATSEVYLGREPPLGDTARFAAGKIPSILLVSVLSGLAVIGGLLLLIIGAVFFFIRFAFAPIAVVVEGNKGRSALGRSWRLTKGNWWRIFGIYLLAWILTAIVGGILAAPFAIGSLFLGEAGWFTQAVGQSIGTVLTTPFMTMVLTHLYFDLRIRKEAFDLTLLAQELESPSV